MVEAIGFVRDQQTAVCVRLESIGDETRVTAEHCGWDTVPGAHVARHGFPNALFLRRHGEWWQTLLENLKTRARPAVPRQPEPPAMPSRPSNPMKS